MTGTYTREPQMANMIRTPIDLGFEIFAYEKVGKGERDLKQAKNIQRFLDSHPEGKTVIHCGWYHAIESDRIKRRKEHWMAYHIKDLTGINPFTIYQDGLSEKGGEKESPYFQMVNAKKVSVLVDNQGNVFNGADSIQHFDVMVYHPRTTYTKNRPTWLLDIEENQLVNIPRAKMKGLKFPVIVKAFSIEEGKDATPLDIVEIQKIREDTDLVLPKGSYDIEIIDLYKKKVEFSLKAE